MKLLTEAELIERAKQIRCLLLDVDGVLTTGQITYTEHGDEVKGFHVRDGSGLKIWMSLGNTAVILSGRTSTMVTRRAVELGIGTVIQGRADKWTSFQGLLASQELQPESICAIGDDLPELAILGHVGLGVAVADACPEIREAAHYVTSACGGHGAVRETIEWILKLRGQWKKVVDSFQLHV